MVDLTLCVMTEDIEMIDNPDEKYKALCSKLQRQFGDPIPLGDYIGNMPKHQCERNSFINSNYYDVYQGVILFWSKKYSDWDMATHYFNVCDGEVFEFTDLSSEGEEPTPGSVVYYGLLYKGPTDI